MGYVEEEGLGVSGLGGCSVGTTRASFAGAVRGVTLVGLVAERCTGPEMIWVCGGRRS